MINLYLNHPWACCNVLLSASHLSGLGPGELTRWTNQAPDKYETTFQLGADLAQGEASKYLELFNRKAIDDLKNKFHD